MKKVIIVGGGVAGLNIAKILSKNSNIETTLVEPKEYIEVPFAQLRALVEPGEFSSSIRKLYSQLIPTVTQIRKKAVGIKDDKLLIEDESVLDFDYLVIATGSKFPNWSYLKSAEINMKVREKEVIKESKKIEFADSIMIIGGGSVGVELAGEIAYKWKDKRITIVNGGSRILSGLSPKMSKHSEKVLNSMGVRIINNTILNANVKGTWSNKNGDIYDADIVYQAVGMVLDSDWITKDSEIEKTDRGAIKVDSSLRVVGRANIFAIGDITDVPEIKLGAYAVKHASLTAKNINSLINNSGAKLKTYKPGKTISMIPIGKKVGSVQLPFGHPHFLIAIKQKNLFSSKVL